MQELKVKSKLRGLKEHHSTKSLLVPTQGRDLTFRDPRQANRASCKQARQNVHRLPLPHHTLPRQLEIVRGVQCWKVSEGNSWLLAR